jgi:DNA helicase-2/ATP-dependent DNA helicase PcrA
MDVLAGLNAQQAEAVAYSGGPLAVLAGPGTGKTRLIVHRVARLLLEGAPARSIVALTFTIKAAAELRARLAQMLSAHGAQMAASADEVVVSTYHGYGRRLLLRFAGHAGLGGGGAGGGGPGLIDEAQQRRALRELIEQRGLMPSMHGLGVRAGAQRVLEVLAALGDRAISPLRAREWVRERRAALQAGPDGAGVRGALDELALLDEALVVAHEAQAMWRARGELTFNDLLTLPIELLRTRPLVAGVVRGEVRHLVVDEFQDVNAATVLLLRELKPPAPEGEAGPDVCVVGDDDQSIYGFRGADDRAFARFAQLWPGARVIELSENYRSHRAVVEAGARVIARAQGRFAPDKRLRASGAGAGAPGGGVQVVTLAGDKENAPTIGAWLARAKADEPARPWADYALIARNHGELARIAVALGLEGIPRRIARASSLADDQGVQDVLSWCRLLTDARDTHSARHVLSRPPVLVPGRDLLALERDYGRARLAFDKGHAGAPDPGGYVQWLSARAHSEGAGLEPGVRARIGAFVRLHEELLGLLAGLRADAFVHELALRADVVHADLLPPVLRAERLRAVVALLRLARERQARLARPGDVRAFLAYLDDFEQIEQALAPEAADRVEGGAVGEGEGDEQDAVQLLTAHASKGLEFDTVLLARVNAPHGYPSVAGAPDQDALPAELMNLGVEGPALGAEQRRAAEERRIFYVACTRAKRRLVAMGRVPKKPGKSEVYLADVLGAPAQEGVTQRTGESVLSASPAPRDEAQRELARERRAQEARGVGEQLLAQARAEAAGALADAQQLGADERAVRQAQERLAGVARRLAIIGRALETGQAPAWLKPGTDEAGEALVARLRDAAVQEEPAGAPALALDPVRAPFDLSYTKLHDYERCPACWYCKYVLGHQGPAPAQIEIGTVVHGVLQVFYERWRSAGAEGLALPGLHELHALGREAFFGAPGLEASPGALAQVLAQLSSAHTRLHDPDANILELEHKTRFALTIARERFTVETKIDRVDKDERAHPARFVIIDYKTGKPRRDLLEPPATDLQMGLYAMALAHAYGDGQPVAGAAEYWLLATGQRGRIDLSAIDLDKVRARIEGIVQGILAGEFAPARDCEGACRLLRPGG